VLPRLQPKPFIHKRAGDGCTVSLCNADAARDRIPMCAHVLLHLMDDVRGFIAREQKSHALRHQVSGVRITADITDREGEIASLVTDGWERDQVVDW
jgi:hypothetical protein